MLIPLIEAATDTHILRLPKKLKSKLKSQKAKKATDYRVVGHTYVPVNDSSFNSADKKTHFNFNQSSYQEPVLK